MLNRFVHRLRSRLSFANLVAVLALFIALGGTSFGRPVVDAGTSAVSTVKKALGLSKKADRNSRRALKLARRADKTAKAALAKAGVPGPAGSAGPAGTNGSALAYAAIAYCQVTCEDQPSSGWYVPDEEAHAIDNQANFNNPSAGVYCFHDLIPEVHNVVAIMGPGSTNRYLLQARAGTTDDPIGAPCTPGGGVQHNAIVEVRDADTGALVDPNHGDEFFALFN